ENQPEAVELLFDDDSDNPFALHLTPASFDLLPGPPEPGREWTFAAWTEEKGKPHLALQRVCHWRPLPRLPWLEPRPPAPPHPPGPAPAGPFLPPSFTPKCGRPPRGDPTNPAHDARRKRLAFPGRSH